MIKHYSTSVIFFNSEIFRTNSINHLPTIVIPLLNQSSKLFPTAEKVFDPFEWYIVTLKHSNISPVHHTMSIGAWWNILFVSREYVKLVLLFLLDCSLDLVFQFARGLSWYYILKSFYCLLTYKNNSSSKNLLRTVIHHMLFIDEYGSWKGKFSMP